MGDKLKKIKLDKLVSEMNFLETELKYQKAITETTVPDFNLKVREELEKRGKKQPTPEKPALNRAQRRAAKKASKGTSKIFKQIAKQIHPDKLLSEDAETQKKKEKFLEATEAKEEDNSLKLYSIARELGILELELENEDIEHFEKQLCKTKKDISLLTTSWVYVWGTQDSIEIKKSIIEKFVDLMTEQSDKQDTE